MVMQGFGRTRGAQCPAAVACPCQGTKPKVRWCLSNSSWLKGLWAHACTAGWAFVLRGVFLSIQGVQCKARRSVMGISPKPRHAQAHVTASVLRGRLLRTTKGARVCDDRGHMERDRSQLFTELEWDSRDMGLCANACSHQMLNDCGVERHLFRDTSSADWSLPLSTCLTDVVCLSSVNMTAAFCEELST